MKIFTYITAFLFVFFDQLYTRVFAFTDIEVVPPIGKIPLPDVNEMWDSWDLIGTLIAWFIWLTAVLAILAITWAAIHMVLAVGDEEKMKKARYTMIYAFIWLFVSGMAYGAVTLVTGLNLNNFL